MLAKIPHSDRLVRVRDCAEEPHWSRHATDRGGRRIIAGGGASGDPATSGEYYYTDDHYNSFRRIQE